MQDLQGFGRGRRLRIEFGEHTLGAQTVEVGLKVGVQKLAYLNLRSIITAQGPDGYLLWLFGHDIAYF